ncbi:MAG: Imm44 family immunity protein [Pyrinomonadaceae bacterium]
MKFALTVEASEGVADKTRLINDLSDNLSTFLLGKEYGNDVIQMYIRIICVAPEFEWFSTVRKPRYKFYETHVRDGVEIVEDRLFSFSRKIDYEKFRIQSDDQNVRMLADEIAQSLANLESLPKKVKDFDKKRFRDDLQMFLKNVRYVS